MTVRDIVAATKPVVVQGHLAVARAVGSGEYNVALNNYLNLTINVKLAGQPTDFWVLEPVALAQVAGDRADADHVAVADEHARLHLDRDAIALARHEFGMERARRCLGAVGDQAGEAVAAFGAPASHAQSIEQLLERVQACATPQATLLVKGSRFMRMERVVNALTGETGGVH